MNKFIHAVVILAIVISPGFAATILIVNGDFQSEIAQDTTNVAALEMALGNTVAFASTVPGSLAGYLGVFDLRFSDSTALTNSDVSAYIKYLTGGGSLYLMGENGSFLQRDNSLFSFIHGLGGGTFSFVNGCTGFAGDTQIQAAVAPFNGPNPVNGPGNTAIGALYNCEGNFNNSGTGQFVTIVPPAQAGTKNGGNQFGAGIAFAPGTLSGAPGGRLVSLLDSDFMINVPLIAPGDSRAIASQNLVQNLVLYVNLGGIAPVTAGPSPGPAVPEPASLTLIAVALGLGILRKRGSHV